MEEKQKKGVSPLTIVCVFIIIALIVALVFVCFKFVESNDRDIKEIGNLKENLKTSQEANQKLQGKLDELQEKIDDLDDAINNAKSTAEQNTTTTPEPKNDEDK